MAHSSPEGIELGKGSQLVSMELSINKEKVLSIKQERSYSEEEVINILVEFSAEVERVWNITEWFNKFKKK